MVRQGDESIFLAVVVARSRDGQIVLEMGFGFHAFIDMSDRSDDSSLNSDDAQFLVDSFEVEAYFCWYFLFYLGMLLPIAILLFFDYNVVVGMAASDDFLKWMIYFTLILYVAVALRGSSALIGERMKNKSKEIYEVRPYLDNPNLSCQGCGIIRLFRATHCPFCKTCIAKHSRHSIVFGSCIGAANEMLCIFFFFFLWISLNTILIKFWWGNSYGFLTKLMFYLLNIPLCWMSFGEFMQFFVFVLFCLFRIMCMELLSRN